MENKLVGGDYAADGCGGIVRLYGSQALVARALFCLTCQRGSFPFLPELGSRLRQLKAGKPAALKSTAMFYASEAVAPLGLTVTDVRVVIPTDGTLSLAIELAIDEQTQTVEVTV